MHKRAWYSIFSILVVIVALAWLAVLARPSPNLKIIACEVGQGDATLIIQGNFQMLIDGGPSNRVIACLSKYVPFWDRTLEIVVLTHPDADHYTGLIEVFGRYNVAKFLATEVNKDNPSYEELKSTIANEHTELHLVREGNRIVYGDLYIDILNPSRTKFVSSDHRVLGSMDIDEEDSNSYSIAMDITYGEFDALITGDLTPDLSDSIVNKGLVSQVEYLQVPHHGSKNGLTKALLQKASPELAVISAGKNNRYGHPHPEIIKMLEGIKTLGTYEVGDVVVESDGKEWKVY